MDGYGEQAGIGFKFSILLGLFGLDDTRDAHVEKTADMGGLIHAHENVERVAVLAECGGMKPKSKGNTMPSGSRPPDLNRFDSGS